MRCYLESTVISQFHCAFHIVDTTPYGFLLLVIFHDGTEKMWKINEQFNPSNSDRKKKRKVFRQRNGQWINVNVSRTEKESSFCVCSFESLNKMRPKIQDQYTVEITRRTYRTYRCKDHHPIKWREKRGQPHNRRGRVERVANMNDIQKLTQRCCLPYTG